MTTIYETPKSDLEGDRKGVTYTRSKLFKLSGITIATFIGSIIAGAILMAINYSRLGQSTHARLTIIYGFIATVALFTAFYFLPENIPGAVFQVPQLVGMYQLAKYYQGKDLEAHEAAGGALASNWIAFAISLLVAIVLVALVFAVMIAIFGF